MTKYYFDNILDELNPMFGYDVYKDGDEYLVYDTQEKTLERLTFSQLVNRYIECYEGKKEYECPSNCEYQLFESIQEELRSLL